jgi:hypothetical protein
VKFKAIVFLPATLLLVRVRIAWIVPWRRLPGIAVGLAWWLAHASHS